MTKKSSFLKSILMFGGGAILIALYSNCANTESINSPTGSSQGTCTEAQLADIRASIISTLSTVSTDADFSFAIMTEDGRGMTYDRGASTMTSSYESASTSKWPTATIILSFMESNANQNSPQPLRLNSKPQDFLDPSVWTIDPTDPLYNMNLRQLFSFTSGLSIQPTCLRPGNGALTNFDVCINNIATLNANNGKVPGTEFNYNSDHLQVAGAMAIKARNTALGVSNSTWQDLVADFKAKTHLFPNSVYDSPSLANPRLAGGMHWTGNDYMGFLRANYYNEILSAATMPGESAPYRVQQFTDQIDGMAIGNSPAITDINEEWHYGFGLWLECHSLNFNCQSNVTRWASPGSLGSYPFIDRGHKFYGIIARQGGLATFNRGYAVYMSVSDLVNKWATKNCSQ